MRNWQTDADGNDYTTRTTRDGVTEYVVSYWCPECGRRFEASSAHSLRMAVRHARRDCWTPCCRQPSN